jgi:hypothetical protein
MITEKEKRILKLLVKKYSRDILETSMDEYISSNGYLGTEIVDNIFIPLGYENFTSRERKPTHHFIVGGM